MPFEQENAEDVIRAAKLCAEIILENGGETYRAEETVFRICRCFGFEETDVFATPTGVFISVSAGSTSAGSASAASVNTCTTIKRIRKRGADLQAVDTVNDISRKLTGGKISLSEALGMLNGLCVQKPLQTNSQRLFFILAAGLASGFSALLFKGDMFDFLAATLCGMLVQFVAGYIKAVDTYNFAISILGGSLIGLGSVLFVRLTGTGHIDKIITGAIMPLLPGIPMTNAIRDTMHGDLLSGVARGAEATLIAVALAFGVGVILKLYFQFFA